MSKRSAGWDWTFHYDLSSKITPSKLSNTPEIRFVTDSKNNVTGFEVKKSTPGDKAPEGYCDNVAEKVALWLTAKSMTPLASFQKGYEGKPKTPGRLGRVAANLQIRYNIEGPVKSSKVDLSNLNIQKMVKSDKKSNDLEDLNNAVSHLRTGKVADSIKVAFRIIEGKTNLKGYAKYKCIRNIVTHKKLHNGVKNDFIRYFDSHGSNAHNAFDFKKYEPNKNIIIFNIKSHKTKQTLEQVARDIIEAAKGLLGL